MNLHSGRSGTGSLVAASNVVTGVGTAFTTELQVGDAVTFGADTNFVRVTAINSDTEIVVDAAAQSNNNSLSLNLFEARNEDYIIFEDIGEILNNI